MFCDFCPCEMCQTGCESLIDLEGNLVRDGGTMHHAQCSDGRWICDTCYFYECCVNAGVNPCKDRGCSHRPKLISEWTVWSYSCTRNSGAKSPESEQKVNYNKILETGDLGVLMGALDHYKTLKSTPKYVKRALEVLGSRQNALDPLPLLGDGKTHEVDGIEFTLPELSLRGARSAVVDSRTVADRLGADRHAFQKTLGANLKFLNEFGVMHPISETSGAKGGRPGKHYMLNFQQLVYIALRTETESGRRFAVTVVKAFDQLLDWYIQVQPVVQSVIKRQGGYGALEQAADERLAHNETKRQRDFYKAEVERLTGHFADGAFEAGREVRRAPGSKRVHGGHAGTISKTVVNSVVQ